jgi:protein-L-isoaspartate(D-aspartate) O-methyltransferase
MTRRIDRNEALISQISATGRYAQAMRDHPRYMFIAEVLSDEAGTNAAVPIGHGVNCSRPSTIMRMLSLLEPEGKVLEVGTGCGWQTAMLSSLCSEVYSIEIIPELAQRAARDCNIPGVTIKHGDGNEGWPEAAPFDRIIVCAGSPIVPPALFDQLKTGGLMVIPLGTGSQDLCTVRKLISGEPEITVIEPSGFVWMPSS